MAAKNLPVQNAIRMSKFFIRSLDYNAENIIEGDISEQLEISLNLSTGFDNNKNQTFIVIFKLGIISENKDLQIDVDAVALFETENAITDEFRSSSFVKVNAPAIAFPFLRSYINTLTTNSGISPIILPSFNFTKFND